jgi:hypothetical protein
MSELSNSNALPSISCKKNKGTTGSPSTTTTISPLFHGQWLYHVVWDEKMIMIRHGNRQS